ncbi:TIGR02265 family protein [Archangium sp.]|jgi:uncharacterized protein (TIGR02265 family)|uniref:TIGR02265 family protein n=1 Tax=Archangium sp. TaxID=1872627 RepID=UPI002EDAE998
MRGNSAVALEAQAFEYWEQDFARRMALAKPTDTSRGVFCNGFLRMMRELGGEAMEKRCLEASGEEKFVDFFFYPITIQLRMLTTGMRLLAEQHGDVEEALRRLGRQAVTDLAASAAGRAVSLMGTGDMRSLLEGLRAAYRVSANYGEHELEWTGPTSARLTLKRIFMPYPFHEGLVLARLESRNVRHLRVRGRQLTTLDSEYEISWE